MKIVTFLNFTNEDFTYSWDSQPHTIKAHEQVEMEDWRANHAAKHLVNRELNKADLSQYCSPKIIKDVPQFYELYQKAVIEHTVAPEVKAEDAAMAVANSKPEVKAKKPVKVEKEFEELNT